MRKIFHVTRKKIVTPFLIGVIMIIQLIYGYFFAEVQKKKFTLSWFPNIDDYLGDLQITIVTVIFCTVYVLLLRCHQCNKLIYKRKINLLGFKFTFLGGFYIPKHCPHCGVAVITQKRIWNTQYWIATPRRYYCYM